MSVKQVPITFDRAEPERVAQCSYEVWEYVVPPPVEGYAPGAEGRAAWVCGYGYVYA
ncbi:hypothetical protein [Streptomyces halstedii]|uniref:hypothetical protein n=1 Tax=Streptomyces halstedii TaxID=1944 RepID=UPI003D9F2EB0